MKTKKMKAKKMKTKILSKTLYKNYGIILKESESAYFDFVFSQNNCLEKSLKEFYNNCQTRYFKKSKIKVIKEEIGRNVHTPNGKGTAPNGKGAAGNITDQQLISDQEGLYLEDTVDTMSGKEAVYLEDEDKNELYKDMEEEYIHIFTRNIRTKNISK